MIAPAPMAITPKRRNGHARRHPKLRSFQGLPFFAKGRTLDLSTTPGSNADVSVEWFRSEEHTSELPSLMRISYAVFSLKTKKKSTIHPTMNTQPTYKPQLTNTHTTH